MKKSETVTIQFIKNIMDGRYQAAHKNLKSLVNYKVQERVNKIIQEEAKTSYTKKR